MVRYPGSRRQGGKDSVDKWRDVQYAVILNWKERKATQACKPAMNEYTYKQGVSLV